MVGYLTLTLLASFGLRALEKWLESGDNEFFCDTVTGLGSEALRNHPHVNCVGKASGGTYESTFRLSDKVLNNIRNFLEM